MFEHDYEYELTDKSIRITKYTGKELRVEVPDRIGGLCVQEIGDYAFSGCPAAELHLPPGIVRIGRYAFYNCSALKKFSFFNRLRDFGAGAFTGCHRISHIRIELEENEASSLRDVLMEVAEELLVEYHYGGKTALLLFPEFFEEGVENTPARIIVSQMHGSGLLYRNCFVDRKLQFQEYDRRFANALGQESEDFLIRLACCRLRYPFLLSSSSRSVYETYLKEHFQHALEYWRRLDDRAMTGFLMNLHHQGPRIARPDFDL
ncbi:MAG: leucine-rich repeat domain-containing protein [Blautia sp.]|nr:leucine-rich repeat domain-containing protein [Blautia sp.]